jgi:hypothetical protein
MELHVPTVVLENSLLKAPRSAPHARAARSKILQLRLVAVNVLLVPPVSLSLLVLVQLAKLVVSPRPELTSVAYVSLVLSKLETNALLALPTPSLLILVPRRAPRAFLALILKLDLPNVLDVRQGATSTRPLARASSVLLASSRIAKERKPARSVLLESSAMRLERILAIPALLVNTTLSQALLPAVSALGEPSPLPARVLAPSAPRVNSLLLELLLALVALLDTTQTSLGLGLVQHVRLGPNAQALPSPPPLSVLLALSSPSLLRLRVHHALSKQTLLNLALPSVQHALLPLHLVLQLALLVAGLSSSPVSILILSTKKDILSPLIYQ